jgi:hypothetical protein
MMLAVVYPQRVCVKKQQALATKNKQCQIYVVKQANRCLLLRRHMQFSLFALVNLLIPVTSAALLLRKPITQRSVSNSGTAVNSLDRQNLFLDQVYDMPSDAIISAAHPLAVQPLHHLDILEKIRGGATDSGPIKKSFRDSALTAWGISYVVATIANAIRRLLPIALQPYMNFDISQSQLAAYVCWTGFMLYTEGYKAFHQKFAPLVVKRACTLKDNYSALNVLFAGPYCMGMYNATKKRKIVSWTITVGVTGLVFLVKHLPYPWRSIVDGGVVAGLTYGCASILYYYSQVLMGYDINVDPCMPEPPSVDNSIKAD